MSQSFTTQNPADNAITNAKLRDSAALSVIGRSANSSGDPADIVGATVGSVFQILAGPTLGFGAVVSADVYTPTYTPVTNVSAVTHSNAFYWRIGSNVIVFGLCLVDAVAAGAAVFGISLPVAANFTAGNQVAGLFRSEDTIIGRIQSSGADDWAHVAWSPTSIANQFGIYVFGYKII